MSESDSPAAVELSREAASRVIVELLTACSVFEVDAEVAAEAMLWGEQVGRPGDGLALLPSIVEQITSGVIDPRGRPLVMCDSPAIQTIDGSSGVGPVAAAMAVGWLAEAARTSGTATVLVKGGRDLGDPAWIVHKLGEQGLVGVCVTAVMRETPMIRAAAASAGVEDEGRPAVRWEGPPSPLVEAVISGLTGGRAVTLKADAPNPAVCEHVIVAYEPETVGGSGRLGAKLSQMPEGVCEYLPTSLAETVLLSRETAAAVRRLAEERGVSAGELAAG